MGWHRERQAEAGEIGFAPQDELPSTGVVSLRADVPAGLLASMQAFIEQHPNWDQYRLVQAAVAGFLVQNGSRNREVTRCYLANLFPGQRGFTATVRPSTLP